MATTAEIHAAKMVIYIVLYVFLIIKQVFRVFK